MSRPWRDKYPLCRRRWLVRPVVTTEMKPLTVTARR